MWSGFVYLARLLLVPVRWRPSPLLQRWLLSVWLWFAAFLVLGFYSTTVPPDRADVVYTLLGIVAIVTSALFVLAIAKWIVRLLRRAG